MEHFLGLSAYAWLAIFSGVSATFVSLGGVIAIRSLLIGTRSQRAQAVKSFLEDLGRTSEQRRFVFQEFPRQDDYNGFPLENERKVREVINALTQIAFLIDGRLLPASLALSLCHSVVIRSWYKVELYTAYYERKTGGRYGSRIRLLASRAQRFHDAWPNQRLHPILLDDGKGNSTKVYQTDVKWGLLGAIQRIEWLLRRWLGQY